MKTHLFTIATLIFFVYNIEAQTLGEFKPKDASYGLGKLKSSNKKLYIADFVVNYQVYNEKEKFKQGGHMLGGGQKGDAHTAISVGLEGLDEKTIQDITDKLYAEFLDKMKAKGITIISADEAAKIEAHEDYERVKGGTVSFAQLPGVVSTTPTGFEFFVKGFDKKGKAKKGGFLGVVTSRYPRLSKELGDAIVANVTMNVMFVRDQQAFQGNGAKLKVKTDLRLSAQDAIVMASDAKFKMKGQNTVTGINSVVEFYHGKVGAGATTVYQGSLKNDLMINGVVDGATVTSYAAGSMDGGTKTMYGTYFNPKNGTSATTKVVKTDPVKYSQGVYAATSKFLNFHTDEFLKSL